MANSSKKILFLSVSGIGNFLMQSPVFKLVKQAHPDWHITAWVAPRGTKALAEVNPYIDEVFEAPIKANPVQHFLTSLELSKRKFDYGVMLSSGQLLKGAAFLFLAGIPNRIGHTYPLKNNPHSHFLLTKWIDEQENVHDIEQNLALLPLLGIEPLKTNIDYELVIPEENKVAATKLLQDLQLHGHQNLIGFHPGSAADLPFKRWPMQNFAELGKKLIQEQQAHILIFGGPAEQSLVQELHQMLGNHSTVISTNLLTAAAVMQHCRLFISNDSGLMHIAAAVGVPTYGLFGPTSEALTGPRGKNSHVIRAQGTQPAYSTEGNYDLGHDSHELMKALKPEEVYQNSMNSDFDILHEK